MSEELAFLLRRLELTRKRQEDVLASTVRQIQSLQSLLPKAK